MRIKESIAGLCHKQWSGWMDYLFSKGTFNEDGSWTMPKEFVERWKRQAATDYIDLSESEQDSDRKEADKFLEIFEELCEWCGGRWGAGAMTEEILYPTIGPDPMALRCPVCNCILYKEAEEIHTDLRDRPLGVPVRKAECFPASCRCEEPRFVFRAFTHVFTEVPSLEKIWQFYHEVLEGAKE